MVVLISWLHFRFVRVIKIVISLAINKTINLPINRAVFMEKKITIGFFRLFL